MNFGDWAGAVQSIIAAGAIIVAGVWAFFRFVKGRTLKYKAELLIEGTAFSGDGLRGVRVHVHLQNRGVTKIPIYSAWVRVLTLHRPDWRSTAWKRGKTVRVFTDQGWVEPGEPIVDEVLIALDEETLPLAYRLDVAVFSKKNILRRRVGWDSRHVIGGVLQPLGRARADTPTGERSVIVVGQDDRRKIGEQREPTDEEVKAFEREARADQGMEQRAPTDEEIKRYEQEVEGTRQRHPTEEEVAQFEGEAGEGEQTNDEDGHDED
jgi:hypothetical protein